MDTQSTRPQIPFSNSAVLGRLRELFDRWNHKEIEYVRKAVHSTRRPFIRKFSILVSTLSNGWLYAGIVLIIIANLGLSSWPILLCGGMAALLSHCIYPVIKNCLARIRPCEYDNSIKLSIKVLDEYSCPSGHVMTAMSVSIPLAFAMPSFIPLIVFSCLLISWSRISLGHHYPSDLLLGALLGCTVSIPISIPLI